MDFYERYVNYKGSVGLKYWKVIDYLMPPYVQLNKAILIEKTKQAICR